MLFAVHGGDEGTFEGLGEDEVALAERVTSGAMTRSPLCAPQTLL